MDKSIFVIGVILLLLFAGCLHRSRSEITATTLTKVTSTTMISSTVSSIPQAVKDAARKNLSRVKVAVWYQDITDYSAFNRTLADEIKIFNDTHTQFVFRAFWRWNVVPDKPCPEDPVCRLPAVSKLPGSDYQTLKQTIQEIKKERPDIIIVGGVPFERVNAIEKNDITGEILSRDKTWAMALDPGKWGLKMTKEEMQASRGFVNGYANPNLPYDKDRASAYYPDITNPDFQVLLLSWAQKEIDCGVDAVWVDLLYAQPLILAHVTGDSHHPAVNESFEAASRIIDRIHEYGYTKYGRYIYVGTWPMEFANHPWPDIDFFTTAPTSDEIRDNLLTDTKWDRLSEVKNKTGIPVFAVMDEVVGPYKTTGTGMGPFTQDFTAQQQRDMLKHLDGYMSERGIVFIFPLHGPWMGSDAHILSYGKYKAYDAFAPEFGTYDTIKELAENKSGG